MKAYVDEVRYSKNAMRFIRSRNIKEKEKLKNVIDDKLKKLPPAGDIKPLQGYSDGRMRLRVGSMRIIFRYDEENILLILSILDIGNRGNIYK